MNLPQQCNYHTWSHERLLSLMIIDIIICIPIVLSEEHTSIVWECLQIDCIMDSTMEDRIMDSTMGCRYYHTTDKACKFTWGRGGIPDATRFRAYKKLFQHRAEDAVVHNWPKFLPRLALTKHCSLRISFFPREKERPDQPTFSRRSAIEQVGHVLRTGERRNSLGASWAPPYLPHSTRSGWRRGRCGTRVPGSWARWQVPGKNEDTTSRCIVHSK